MVVIDVKPGYLNGYWSGYSLSNLGYLDRVWSRYLLVLVVTSCI